MTARKRKATRTKTKKRDAGNARECRELATMYAACVAHARNEGRVGTDGRLNPNCVESVTLKELAESVGCTVGTLREAHDRVKRKDACLRASFANRVRELRKANGGRSPVSYAGVVEMLAKAGLKPALRPGASTAVVVHRTVESTGDPLAKAEQLAIDAGDWELAYKLSKMG